MLGIAGLTFVTFAIVSFTEMRRYEYFSSRRQLFCCTRWRLQSTRRENSRRKIDEQVARGEQPYELQVPRKQPKPAKQSSGKQKKKSRKK